MSTLTFNLPALYGDHHVIAVRELLYRLPGVEDVYASSSFHLVEVTYDEAQVSADEIRSCLDRAGYLERPAVPEEGATAYEPGAREKMVFRHTTALAQTGHVIGFAQKVPYAGRPLWPCPGMEPAEEGLKDGQEN